MRDEFNGINEGVMVNNNAAEASLELQQIEMLRTMEQRLQLLVPRLVAEHIRFIIARYHRSQLLGGMVR